MSAIYQYINIFNNKSPLFYESISELQRILRTLKEIQHFLLVQQIQITLILSFYSLSTPLSSVTSPTDYLYGLKIIDTNKPIEMDYSFDPKGNFYMILCPAEQKSFRIEETQSSEYHKSRIIASAPDPQNNGQIFMLEPSPNDDKYEIVNCVSNLVLEDEAFSKKIKLHTGARKKQQLFKIERCPAVDVDDYYWIRQGKKALTLDATLEIEDYDPDNQKQLFKFVQVTNQYIQNSALIVNNSAGKVIEIPESSREHGDSVHLWERTNRWKQRWHFERYNEGFIIRNIFNELCLNISNNKNDSKSSVVQWEKHKGANQLWEPEYCGGGLWKFRSVLNPALCLGVKKQDKRNGSHLKAQQGDNPSMYWRIEARIKELIDEGTVLELITILF